jgi:hypothetical protein
MLGLTACSTDIIESDRVHSEDVYQDYQIFYRAENQTTEVIGTFRLGGPTGTTLEFKEPSKLTVNNYPTANTKFLGSRYTKSFPNELVPLITTVWTNQEGQIFTNQYELRSASLAPDHPTRISRSLPTEVHVFAPELKSSETLELVFLQDSDQTINRASAQRFDPQTSTIRIEPADLLSLKAGTARMILYRRYDGTLIEKTPKGGSATVTYQALPVTVFID